MATFAVIDIELEAPLTDECPPPSCSQPQETSPGQVKWTKLARTFRYMKKFSMSTEESSTSKDRSEFMVKHKYNDPTLAGGGWVPVTKKIHFIFKPNSRFIYWWMFIVSLFALYNVFIIIARQTFPQLHSTNLSIGFWLTIDSIADIVYIVDMVIRSHTGFLEQGLLVTEPRKTAVYYLKSWAFRLDIVSIVSIPVEIVVYAVVSNKYTIIRIARVLKIHRVFEFFQQTDISTNWPNLFRLFTLILYLLVIIHWNACVYFLISKQIGFGEDQWVYPMIEGNNANDTEYSNLFRQYIVSMYWSTLTLTTIGEVPGPVTNGEYAFVVLDYLLGVLVFAGIIGMVGDIINNMTSQRTAFQNRLDTIKRYMRFRKVGKNLQKRVIKWFDYLWTSKHTIDENEILKSLPDKLHAEISMEVNYELLKKIDIFDQCETGLLEELVLKLQPQVYSPGDYVCRKGDVGRELFIVKRGRLHVTNDEGVILSILTNGSHFGEISVLHLSSKGNKRTVTVRSVGFSDLFSLAKCDLLEVLQEYPETRRILEEKGKHILIADGITKEEDTMSSSLKHPQDNLLAIHKKVDYLTCKIQEIEEKINKIGIIRPPKLRDHTNRPLLLEEASDDEYDQN